MKLSVLKFNILRWSYIDLVGVDHRPHVVINLSFFVCSWIYLIHFLRPVDPRPYCFIIRMQTLQSQVSETASLAQ